MTDPTRSHTESQADPRASRRSFLKIAGIGGAVLIAGCDTDEPDPIDPGTFGTLTGTVVDDDGMPLADVTISFAAEDITRTATTGENGMFTIENLPVGTYTVVATTANFVMEMQENVTITAGSSTSVDFTLVPGGDIVFDFEDDFGVLNLAYALEQLEAAFYAEVIAHPDFAMTFDAEEQDILRDLASHEAIHRDFFEAAISGAGGTFNNRDLIPPLTPTFEEYDFSSREDVLELAQTLENLGVSAYNGAAEFLSTTGAGPDYLLIAGKIVSVEARHAAVISALVAEDPTVFASTGSIDDMGLEEALPPSDVVAAIDSFFVNGVSAINV